MSKSEMEGAKNDWDEDDDDWGDWGDAEDNMDMATATKTTIAAGKDCVQKLDNCNVIKDSNRNSNNKTEEGKTAANKWSMWDGMASVLSQATEGLTTKMNQVIGVPQPEELAAARLNAEHEAAKANETTEKKGAEAEAKQTTHMDEDDSTVPSNSAAFGLSLVTGVTSLGSKVLNTGLDTLEGIGKKTMTVLQENDPLLLNKRKMLGLEPDRPNLSEILKEAKKDADHIEETLRELNSKKCKAQLRFDVIFENNCGLVHLEALEILSKESALKLKTLTDSVSGEALTELCDTMNEVKELMDFGDLEGESDGDYEPSALNEVLIAAIADVELPISFEDIEKVWSQSLEWLTGNAQDADAQQIFAKGITALAETCALEVCKLHKIAELLLVREHHSTANEFDSIVQLCKQFNVHLHGLTNRFADNMLAKQTEDTKDAVSTLFEELVLAKQEIEKAYKCFVPILQIGAV